MLYPSDRDQPTSVEWLLKPLQQTDLGYCADVVAGERKLLRMFYVNIRYLCKEFVSPNTCLYIYNKKCSSTIGNCRQANGDNRHIVPDVPAGLGRDIRDMPIVCARTHPDANKHARHIPMYRPVH